MTEPLTSIRNLTTLNDEQWDAVKDLFDCRRKRKHTLRGVIDAILYVALEDIHWRMLPREFAPWQTVYYYYDKWKKTGIWNRVLEVLPDDIRRKANMSAYVSPYHTVDVHVIKAGPQPAKAEIHSNESDESEHAKAQRTYAWILREFFDTEETPTHNQAA